MSSPREHTINQAKTLFDKVGFGVFDMGKVYPFTSEDIEHIRMFNLIVPAGGTGRYKFKKSPFEMKQLMF